MALANPNEGVKIRCMEESFLRQGTADTGAREGGECAALSFYSIGKDLNI